MIFNIDPSETLGPVIEAMEEAGRQLSEEKFIEIAEKMDDALPGVIEYLVNSTYEFWRAEASSTTTGWGPIYAKSIKRSEDEVYVDETMKTMKNKPAIMFVEMVEKGMRSFSIRDGLLASDKAKTGANGVRYITVPFPVGVPRRTSQGKQTSHFGGRQMAQKMHDIVKSGKKIVAGTLKTGQDVSGLTKYVTRQRHEQYGIFRCVSDKTPSNRWLHPGVPAEPVFEKVKAYVNTEIQKALNEFCHAIVQDAMR